MVAPPLPQTLDEGINLISAAITTVCGLVDETPPPAPASHTSAASISALEPNGPLGVGKLHYDNYTTQLQFVESFKKTPLPQPDSEEPHDRRAYRSMTDPHASLHRPKNYKDEFTEMPDRAFLSDLYAMMVDVLRSHVLHAWKQTPDGPPPELMGALGTLMFLNYDATAQGTQADMRCEIEWKGKMIAVLRFEVKHNGFALRGNSIAGLISRWRDQKISNISNPPNCGGSPVAASRILIQLWNSSFKDDTPAVSQSVYGAYFVGASQQEGKSTIFLSENLMAEHLGVDNDARSNPEVYRHLGYTFCWNLIYAINMKLGGEGLQLYPPVEEYEYLNKLGRDVPRDGGPKQGFRKWGSWLAGWFYQLFGLQLPLIARKIRVSPISEAFEIVGRESSYFTLDLFLDEIVPSTTWSIVRFSRSLGLVLKTYNDVELFRSEKSAYEKLGESTFFPRLVAEVRGENSGDPGLLITYCGERVLKEDIQRRDRARISEALKFMHAKGVHHHDIHPRNLVRREDGRISVIDFGLSVPSGQCEQRLCEDRRWILGEIGK